MCPCHFAVRISTFRPPLFLRYHLSFVCCNLTLNTFGNVAMIQKYLIALGVIVGFLLYRIGLYVQQRRAESKLARKWNCSPCPTFPHADPLGLWEVRLLLSAAREGKLLHMISHWKDMMSEMTGRPINTFQGRTGSRFWMTSDPKNIQALLATNFQDFDLGPTRRSIFSPL